MPVASYYPKVDIPNVDLWSFLFERQDRPFPDDKSESLGAGKIVSRAVKFTNSYPS